MIRRYSTILALCVAPLALPTAARSSGAGGTGSEPAREAAFEAGWQVVAGYLADQHWDRARERLLPLLEDHRGAPYVLLRRPQIVDALQRIGFYRLHRPPEPEDLVHGQLVGWRPHSGQIELRYGPSQLADFLVHDRVRGGFRRLDAPPQARDLVLHPAHFTGPCTITIEGQSFAPTDVAPSLVVWTGPDSQVVATLGFRARVVDNQRVHALPSIRSLERGSSRELASDTTAPIETGEPYTVELALEASNVTLSVNGERFLSARRPPGPRGSYGQLGLTGFPDLARVTLEGKIEAAWLEGLADSALQRQWIEFHRRRDPQQDLPEWLRMPRASWDLGLQDPRTVRSVEPAVRDALAKLQELIAAEEFEAARQLARSLEAARDPLPAQIAWLLVESSQGRWSRALERADAILEDEPDLRYVRRFRAAIELSLHDLAAAREHLDHELKLDPGDEWARARLTKLELLAGNLTEVDAALREAARAGRYTPELDDVNRTLTKARNGPPWATTHEYHGGRFVVRSDIDRATCLEASKALNTSLGLFEKWIRPLPRARRDPFSVYLFSGQWGYLSYGSDVFEFAPENTAGVYSPWLRQLLIWNLPEREEMLATVRHEGFHQYLDSLVGVAPMWLNEGMAELFEAADPSSFTGRRIPPAPEHVALLQSADRLIPLEHFLYMGRTEFMASASLNYAQAWALCHMLFEDSRSGRHLLLDLIDRLSGGETPSEAIDGAFGRQDLEKLDRALAEHVAGL